MIKKKHSRVLTQQGRWNYTNNIKKAKIATDPSHFHTNHNQTHQSQKKKNINNQQNTTTTHKQKQNFQAMNVWCNKKQKAGHETHQKQEMGVSELYLGRRTMNPFD